MNYTSMETLEFTLWTQIVHKVIGEAQKQSVVFLPQRKILKQQKEKRLNSYGSYTSHTSYSTNYSRAEIKINSNEFKFRIKNEDSISD